MLVNKNKTIFSKGYSISLSLEVFQIIKVQKTNPVTYLLEDRRDENIEGGFHELVLLKTQLFDRFLVEIVIKKGKSSVCQMVRLSFNNEQLSG